jgi:hypothetical protein
MRVKMANLDWGSFLADWSRELIACEEIAQKLPSEIKASAWLGYPAATEGQIARAESRLGKALPTSYREFLKVSNGWRATGFFIDKIWSTEDIEWFRVRHHEWIADWNLGAAAYAASNPKSAAPTGDDDGSNLPFVLEISDVGDSAIYLLNPLVVAGDGEWQAWFFSNWNPGSVRYGSFQELMEAERKNFLFVRDHRR